jgi:hypothetical protein
MPAEVNAVSLLRRFYTGLQAAIRITIAGIKDKIYLKVIKIGCEFAQKF